MFGMGTGIASPLWPPGIINNACRPLFICSRFQGYPFERGARLDLLAMFRRAIVGIRFLSVDMRVKPFHKVLYKNDNMVKPHDLLVLVG